MRDAEMIDAELRLVALLRRAARERGGALPSIDVADALLDERRERIESISEPVPNAKVAALPPPGHRKRISAAP